MLPVLPLPFQLPVEIHLANGAGAGGVYVWTGGITDGVGFAPGVTDTYTVTGTDADMNAVYSPSAAELAAGTATIYLRTNLNLIYMFRRYLKI